MRTIFERFEPVWPDKIKVPPASKMRVTRQHQPIVSNISNDVVNITLVENLGFLWLQNYNLWIAIGNRFQLIDVNISFSWTICIINSFSVVLMTLFDDNAIIVMAQWSETVDQCLKIFYFTSSWIISPNQTRKSTDQIIQSFEMTVLSTRANFLK